MACRVAAEPEGLLKLALLDGTAVVLAGAAGDAAEPAPGLAGHTGLAALGARIALCALDPSGARALDEAASEEERIEAAAVQALASLGGHADILVVDAASLFAAAGGGRDGLMWSMQACWAVTRAVANATFLPEGKGGRIALIAAPGGPGREHAAAAAAGLENLARTLATEWARYAITTVAIAPGEHTTPGGLETLLAYLASPAGAYFSGTLLDLRGP